ncbi:uncharacterized protein LOC126735446 isoform X2 [Anthonomus grandis grandis]|nr:uncharacterized protein LOC126735446 isoform X2 [Anthonomus grandis grandis]
MILPMSMLSPIHSSKITDSPLLCLEDPTDTPINNKLQMTDSEQNLPNIVITPPTPNIDVITAHYPLLSGKHNFTENVQNIEESNLKSVSEKSSENIKESAEKSEVIMKPVADEQAFNESVIGPYGNKKDTACVSNENKQLSTLDHDFDVIMDMTENIIEDKEVDQSEKKTLQNIFSETESERYSTISPIVDLFRSKIETKRVILVDKPEIYSPLKVPTKNKPKKFWVPYMIPFIKPKRKKICRQQSINTKDTILRALQTLKRNNINFTITNQPNPQPPKLVMQELLKEMKYHTKMPNRFKKPSNLSRHCRFKLKNKINSDFLSETESELEKLFEERVNVLERNKRLLEAAKKQSAGSDSEIMGDSGLVTASSKLDSTSSICSDNEIPLKVPSQKDIFDGYKSPPFCPNLLSPMTSSVKRSPPDKANINLKSSICQKITFDGLAEGGQFTVINYNKKLSKLKDVAKEKSEITSETPVMLVENVSVSPAECQTKIETLALAEKPSDVSIALYQEESETPVRKTESVFTGLKELAHDTRNRRSSVSVNFEKIVIDSTGSSKTAKEFQKSELDFTRRRTRSASFLHSVTETNRIAENTLANYPEILVNKRRTRSTYSITSDINDLLSPPRKRRNTRKRSSLLLSPKPACTTKYEVEDVEMESRIPTPSKQSTENQLSTTGTDNIYSCNKSVRNNNNIKEAAEADKTKSRKEINLNSCSVERRRTRSTCCVTADEIGLFSPAKKKTKTRKSSSLMVSVEIAPILRNEIEVDNETDDKKLVEKKEQCVKSLSVSQFGSVMSLRSRNKNLETEKLLNMNAIKNCQTNNTCFLTENKVKEEIQPIPNPTNVEQKMVQLRQRLDSPLKNKLDASVDDLEESKNDSEKYPETKNNIEILETHHTNTVEKVTLGLNKQKLKKINSVKKSITIKGHKTKQQNSLKICSKEFVSDSEPEPLEIQKIEDVTEQPKDIQTRYEELFGDTENDMEIGTDTETTASKKDVIILQDLLLSKGTTTNIETKVQMYQRPKIVKSKSQERLKDVSKISEKKVCTKKRELSIDSKSEILIKRPLRNNSKITVPRDNTTAKKNINNNLKIDTAPVDLVSNVIKDMIKTGPCRKMQLKKVVVPQLPRVPTQEQNVALYVEPDIFVDPYKDCPKSPDLNLKEVEPNPPPKLIPLTKPQKLPPSKIVSLMQRMIVYSNEEVILDEVVMEFAFQEMDYMIRIIMNKLCLDVSNKVDTTLAPSPPMTTVQRILFGFLLKLEKVTHPGIIKKFMKSVELHLFKRTTCELPIISPLTRVYTALCKMNRNISKIRRFLGDCFYFCENFALPILFIVITMWPEVLPMNDELNKYPLARVIIQLAYTKTDVQPGFNLMPLRDLFAKYYNYPTEKWNPEDIFKDILVDYVQNPSAMLSDYTITLFLKYQPVQFLHTKIHENFIPLYEAVPESNPNLKANLIMTICNICCRLFRHDLPQMKILLEVRIWADKQKTVNRHPVVRKALDLLLQRLPRRARAKRQLGPKNKIANVSTEVNKLENDQAKTSEVHESPQEKSTIILGEDNLASDLRLSSDSEDSCSDIDFK